MTARTPTGGPPPAPQHPRPVYPWLYDRAEPPSVWPVAAFTVVFGILGGISAGRRALRARGLGVGGGRYWGTFAGALVVNLLVSGIIVAILLPVYLDIRQDAVTKDLESRIVSDSAALADGTAPAVAGADCTWLGPAEHDGSAYTCVIRFADGGRGSYRILLGPDRRWTVQR